MAELRAGHLPLWNPYLFAGVPFLANPQAAVLYPLHWPLTWMEPSQALIWSALLHVWLAAGFMYTFARRSVGLGSQASWLAGALFGLGGFTLAKIENINQLNGLAWLPAMLWLLDETATGNGVAPSGAVGRGADHRDRAATASRPHPDGVHQSGGTREYMRFGRLVELVYRWIGRMVERRRSGLSDTAASPSLHSRLPLSHSPALSPVFSRCSPSFRRSLSPPPNCCHLWS